MTDLKILAIDTSGKTASVAISDGARLLWEKTVFTKLTHSQVILPMVESALEETGLDYPDIDCIAIANGPGSYTGLRIGVGAVKGICMGAPNIKAAGVSTLLALAYNCVSFEGKIFSVMRARPKIIYAAAFESSGGKIIRMTEDKVCGEDEFFSQIGFCGNVMLVGDCAEEIKAGCFAASDNVRTAPLNCVLQRASSLCLAVEDDPTLKCSADELAVSYLQATKAEKDKAHRDS
jgi:tRNA threonylcarbamoyladenosine biosynthesis protein TsaB